MYDTWFRLGQMTFAGNPLRNWLIAIVLFLAIFVVLRLTMGVVIARLREWAPKTRVKFDDVFVGLLQEIGAMTYAAAALFLAAYPLSLPAIVDKVIFGFFLLVVMYQVIRILERIIVYGIHRYWFKRRGSDGDQAQMWGVLVFVVRTMLWSVGLLLLLSNLGFNVNSLIASLGITGVAIALAVQNILGDLFSSFSLYLDEPFRVGDFIVVGDDMGTVKKIGLKTTRIQALQGEEIVIPNQQLTTTRVQNYKRMDQRRIEFTFGVPYDTPPDTVAAIPDMVRDIMQAEDKVKIDRIHFKEFAENKLLFECVYIVLTSDYNTYMDAQQRINLAILRAFKRDGLTFAYSELAVKYEGPSEKKGVQEAARASEN